MATTTPPRILVVDDEPDLRTLYELTLLREGYRVDAAASLAEATGLLAAGRFDTVITDMRLPDGLGLELLRSLQTQQRSERCIVMTAYGSAENAVDALKAGAFDYLTKPVDLKQFRTVVASAIQGAATHGATARPRAAAPAARAAADRPLEAHAALQRLVGESTAMRTVKERIAKVARSMAPVLVRGESGTGKELAARALHACSHRAEGPFVAVNCGAIPENLLEAEFFGARKGSYTGASQDRDGYFQAARGGTLFLDEIGDVPPSIQVKLLHVLEEGKVRPVGSDQASRVDVRVVAATHRNLRQAVRMGGFREDLFYRLDVVALQLPPLRQRREDIPFLTEHFLREQRSRHPQSPVQRFSPEAMRALIAYDWPGNVRELAHVVERALVLSRRAEVQPDELPQALLQPGGGRPPILEGEILPIRVVQRRYAAWAVAECGGHRTRAAEKLGVDVKTLYNWLSEGRAEDKREDD